LRAKRTSKRVISLSSLYEIFDFFPPFQDPKGSPWKIVKRLAHFESQETVKDFLFYSFLGFLFER